MAEPRACGVGPVQDSVRRADVNASALGKLETQLIHPPLPLKDSFVKLSSVNLPNKPATSPRAPTKKLRRTAHPLCLCCLQTQHQCCLHLDPGSLTAPVTEVRSPWNPFQICGPVYASFLRVTPALNPSGEAGRLVHRYVWQSRREGFSPARGREVRGGCPYLLGQQGQRPSLCPAGTRWWGQELGRCYRAACSWKAEGDRIG